MALSRILSAVLRPVGACRASRARIALLATFLLLSPPAYAQQQMPTAHRGGDLDFAQPVVILDANGNPVSVGSTATYAAPVPAVTVTTSSTPIIAAGTYTKLIILQGDESCGGKVRLNLASGTAVAGQGPYIPAGGGSITFGNGLPVPTGAISGISESGTCPVSIQGIP